MNSTHFRRIATTLAVVVAAGIAPAAAGAQTNAVRDIAIATGSSAYLGVLDAGSGAAGAKVVQNPISRSYPQRWDVVQNPRGVHIINDQSGMCLTTTGTVGAQLYVTYCNDANPRQDWIFGAPLLTWSSQSGGKIRNPYTGLVVDVKGDSGLAGTPIIGWYEHTGFDEHFGYWHWS
jgi:hypothetical protein